MNSELSRKIIVASGMAVVVGIIAITVSLRSHHPAPVAQTSEPPAALAPVPEAPAPVAPTADVAAAVAPIPDASAAIASNENADAKIDETASSATVEPGVIGNRHHAKARMSANTTDRTVAPASNVDLGEKSADEKLANNVTGATSVVELTIPPTTASTTSTDAQDGATSTEPADSESQLPPR